MTEGTSAWTDPAPYNTFIEDRCGNELGLTWDEARIERPEEAKAILLDVLKHRWPHLRETHR